MNYHYALQSEIPILLNDKKKSEQTTLLRRDLGKIKYPNALNYLFLSDQKLKSVTKHLIAKIIRVKL